MKYLTIDTTTKVTALALGEQGTLVAEAFLHTAKTHSERLIPMLNHLLETAAWRLEDLDFIGVVRGPGSFTGIRIGIATAQGLALVLKRPLVGVLSLDSLAWVGYGNSGTIVPILDARKNEWYTAAYRWDFQGLQPYCLREPSAVEPALWLEQLSGFEGNILLAGDGVLRYAQLIEERLGEKAMVLPDYLALPRGAYTVRSVWERWLKLGQGEEIQPFYIRPSEAEATWAKKEKESKHHGGA